MSHDTETRAASGTGLQPGDIGSYQQAPDVWVNHLGPYLERGEWVYLGPHPDQRCAELGIVRIWVPQVMPAFGQFPGDTADVPAAELTVVAGSGRLS